jgi:hypothetical protein
VQAEAGELRRRRPLLRLRQLQLPVQEPGIDLIKLISILAEKKFSGVFLSSSFGQIFIQKLSDVSSFKYYWE